MVVLLSPSVWRGANTNLSAESSRCQRIGRKPACHHRSLSTGAVHGVYPCCHLPSVFREVLLKMFLLPSWKGRVVWI